ncbi:hypothetical protein D3C72_1783130 [compost metagenome]
MVSTPTATNSAPAASHLRACSSVVDRMPAALPALRMRAMASAIAACTSGWLGWPTKPIEADRSAGPMNTPSTPGVAAMASMFFIASTVSACTSRQVCALASCR